MMMMIIKIAGVWNNHRYRYTKECVLIADSSWPGSGRKGSLETLETCQVLTALDLQGWSGDIWYVNLLDCKQCPQLVLSKLDFDQVPKSCYWLEDIETEDFVDASLGHHVRKAVEDELSIAQTKYFEGPTLKLLEFSKARWWCLKLQWVWCVSHVIIITWQASGVLKEKHTYNMQAIICTIIHPYIQVLLLYLFLSLSPTHTHTHKYVHI